MSDDWRASAACRKAGPGVFYDPALAARAKLICATCPVLRACRTWVLSHPDEQGVWGGWTEADRLRPDIRRLAHGTKSAYNRHLARGEEPCAACVEARRLYDRERYVRRPRPPRTPQPCGTAAAYVRHRYRGEEPCRECKEAHLLYNRERRSCSA